MTLLMHAERTTSMDAHARGDPRAVWLRSLGWHATAAGWWTGHVYSTNGGRYAPMPIDEAFEIAIRHAVIAQVLRVEIGVDRVRIISPWRAVDEQDRPPEPT
jgi:hypothetical protein